jgi:hypothetical protein
MVLGYKSYIKLAQRHPNIPNSYRWLISLLWGDNKCVQWWYVQALIEWTWDKYFENREFINNKKIKTKQEFIDFYNQLPEEDKKMIFSGIKKYIKIIKKYPNIPKSRDWLVILLWGNIKCEQWWYIKALIEWTWDKYFENRESINNKKIKTKQEFIDFYNQLSEEDKTIVFSSNDKYSKRAKNHPNIPKSYMWLIPLLWWSVKCLQWWYVQTLIKWNWDEYLTNRERNINKTDEEKKQEFIDFYNQLPKEDKKMIFGRISYIRLTQRYSNIPNTYRWLISLLWGNNKCVQWWYIKALIEWTWDKYLKNRESINNKKIKTKQEFIDFYNQLPEEDKTMIIDKTDTYEKRVKNNPNVPNTYRWLISLLWGNVKCLQWWYVQALIEWTWDDYFKDRASINNKKIKTKQEFIDFYNQLPEEDKTMIISGINTYRKTAKKYPHIPKSYWWLVALLWGNITCEQWWYIQALIEWTWDDYLKEWKKTKKQ